MISELIDNPLYNYFINNKKNQIDKWMHYFNVYHKYLSEYRNTSFVFVEVGVQNGGSLQMWRDYFGSDARIIGIDIDERCKMMEKEGFEIWIGNQEDPAFWKEFKRSVSKIDVLLDDGGHTMKQQLVTFQEMFPTISEQGYYICEDLHTSYFETHNGGYHKKGTFIEHTKDLIDDMHAWRSKRNDVFEAAPRTANLKGIHIFESIIVFAKGSKLQPTRKVTGNPTVVDNNPTVVDNNPTVVDNRVRWPSGYTVRHFIMNAVNKINKFARHFIFNKIPRKK